ncbi:DUF4112 domain-containing protein [Roseobacter litoralis]|uniref:DUF4112 domain-containing protein n=1 Tax=Roseobacter litoralis (strain ATCC 49566 / DSM 6996 / JCM 21268 / NBRC 15278 / OCh 149) TaxID=391595 RepID=F7ZEQ7_ROSLO|nr:DUF4112 domain-containing protein [Roseobacter litoralis]AEI92138.1 hypothetical protein RLO149_c001060 [Roseobacter litoralis Och 149]
MDEYLTHSQRMNRLARLERIAHRLDNRFRMPLVGLRFGWDSVIGLIPGVGDIATTLPSAFMIYEGAKMGARRRTLLRMGANTAVDFLVGSIPVLGDLFDMQFKSHRRNVKLLRAEVVGPYAVRSA